ncbi:MAG TPA: helix-turn-helix domain-containing protein [Acidimicrobiales bacterium]|nr:helix-turn-helix domain-containing protein [Acidimicrobiales bacterium]
MISVTPRSEADATTDRILDAAYEELLHFGVKGVSVEDIAKRVGVARITIYRRFKNKDELLAAVAIREGQRLFDQIDAAVLEHDILGEQLVEGFAVALHAIRTHPIVRRTLESEPDLVTAFITAQAPVMIGFAREYVAARIAAHRVKVDALAVAELMVRVGATFVLLPESVIKLKTPADARAFARTYLVPMVTR